MPFSEFLSLALYMAKETILYLLAYWLTPLLAFATSVALQALAPVHHWQRWLHDDRKSRRILGAIALGFTRPLSPVVLVHNLRLLHGQSLETIVYLTVSHNLTVYYLFLLGPLLGKDVLLSHLIGGIIFMGVASRLTGLFGVDWTPLRSAPGVEDSLSLSLEKQSFWPLFLDELRRILGLMGYGLLLGGLIAAWGLSPWTVVPAYITTNRWFAQVINALLGGVVSMILWMWPVANLFVGTYLWKIGLAHAGLVTFFYASTLSPQRLRLYAQVKGKEQAIRFGTALALAVILAGLVTAILFHLLGLRINYKLVPEQLL